MKSAYPGTAECAGASHFRYYYFFLNKIFLPTQQVSLFSESMTLLITITISIGDQHRFNNVRNTYLKLKKQTKNNLPFYYLFRGSEFHRLYQRYPHFETLRNQILEQKEK